MHAPTGDLLFRCSGPCEAEKSDSAISSPISSLVPLAKLVDEVSLLISKDFDLGVCCHELACGGAQRQSEFVLLPCHQ